MEKNEIFELSNGIRCVFQKTNTMASHFGVIIKAGTRFETDEQHGLAHFIEHCVFKGTEKRKAFHILNRLDVVGGELNAYTTKEEVCIYGSFLRNHLNRTVELIEDIIFHSNYPFKEIEKEKEIVIDEILSYKDTPSEQIYDDFETYVFDQHPLEKSILGTAESVRSFDKDKIEAYWNSMLHPDNIVISVVGNYSLKRLQSLLEKHFTRARLHGQPQNNIQDLKYKPFQKSFAEAQYQTHTVVGGVAYPYNEERRRSMVLLNNILGGPSLNARLNLGIREKYGYTYNIESTYTPYMDTGVFQIYYGTDPKYTNKTDKLVEKELKRLREKPLGVMQIHQAKEQLKGQIALAQENKASVMLSIGKSLLIYDKVDTLEQVYKDIESVTSFELQEISNEIFDVNKLSWLRFIAED